MYRIYTKGNYFYLIDEADGNKAYEAKANDVLVRTKTEGDSVFYFSNVNQWDESKGIPFSDILDESGVAYPSLGDWVTFYTGFSSALGGSNANDFTGWGQYSDTEYTDVAPLLYIADTVNYTDLPNNSINTLEIQKPLDVTTFYDPAIQKILGRNGDGVSIAVEIDATPASNNGWIEMAINIGGGVGIIYPDTIAFPRGANQSRKVIYKINSGYTLGTWEANGGTVQFRSNVNLEIHSIRYVITRTHKAR